MTKQFILEQARCLSKTEPTELVSCLNQMLLRKGKALTAPPEIFLKDVTQGNTRNSFVLKEFKGYEQGKLYLTRRTRQGDGDKDDEMSYTLFTVYPAGIVIIFTLVGTRCNWRKEITPYIQHFFACPG